MNIKFGNTTHKTLIKGSYYYFKLERESNKYKNGKYNDR